MKLTTKEMFVILTLRAFIRKPDIKVATLNGKRTKMLDITAVPRSQARNIVDK